MGARARAVMAELHGEKIDIVDWSDDPADVPGPGAAARPGDPGRDRRPRGPGRPGHRPRLPALAGHRQGGPERPAGRPAHRLAHRHPPRRRAGDGPQRVAAEAAALRGWRRGRGRRAASTRGWRGCAPARSGHAGPHLRRLPGARPGQRPAAAWCAVAGPTPRRLPARRLSRRPCLPRRRASGRCAWPAARPRRAATAPRTLAGPLSDRRALRQRVDRRASRPSTSARRAAASPPDTRSADRSRRDHRQVGSRRARESGSRR